MNWVIMVDGKIMATSCDWGCAFRSVEGMEHHAGADPATAAPELLEAVKRAYRSFLDWDNESVPDFNLTLALMRSAIAKAEGVPPENDKPTVPQTSPEATAADGREGRKP